MQKLDMEIKCNFNPNYFREYERPPRLGGLTFSGNPNVLARQAGKSADIFVKRPDTVKTASGLSGIKKESKNWLTVVKNYAKNYIKNIKHTYDHKVVYALIEKELFGKISINSITHDLDKMIMYCLGFPKSFVTNFHRKHSAHHPESGKKMNLRSMICDNIASSPEFKPEKKLSLRKHFNTSEALQSVEGFKEILEKYNYGENLNFAKINAEKKAKYKGFYGAVNVMSRTLLFFI